MQEIKSISECPWERIECWERAQQEFFYSYAAETKTKPSPKDGRDAFGAFARAASHFLAGTKQLLRDLANPRCQVRVLMMEGPTPFHYHTNTFCNLGQDEFAASAVYVRLGLSNEHPEKMSPEELWLYGTLHLWK